MKKKELPLKPDKKTKQNETTAEMDYIMVHPHNNTMQLLQMTIYGHVYWPENMYIYQTLNLYLKGIYTNICPG